jgi:predicted RNA-binding protein associated with RNAse of E/G family
LSEIAIRYARPPGRVTVFRQRLVLRTADCSVTLLDHATVERPVVIHDRIVLEPGAPIVWFTFPDTWHDIGRFHTLHREFTGFYANVLTPVSFVSPGEWETTDLFLDVWLDERGTTLLDEDELEAALTIGDVSAADADRARVEAADLLAAAAVGTWPPAICREWTLERATAALGTGADGTPAGGVV